MIFAFFSARLRRWVLLAVLLPLAGRLLETVGVRVEGRSPRAAQALRSTGSSMRGSRSGRGWRRSRRRP